jgi:phage-related protein
MVKVMPASLQKLATSYAKGSMSLGDWRKTLKTLPPEQANLLSQYATLQNKTSGFNDALKRGGPAAQTYTEAIKKMTGGATGLNTTLQLTGENTNGFKDRVTKVSASFNHASKDVEGWNVTQKSFNVQMSRLKEAVNTTAITIGLKLIPVILATIGFFEKHRSACYALAIVIGTVLTAAVISFTVSLWGMVAAAWATGIPQLIIVIGLLTLGIIYLVKHWGDVWNAIKNLTGVVVGWIVGKWNWLWGQTVSVWHSITGGIEAAWHAVASFFTTAWHLVADPIVDAWHWVWSATTAVWNAVAGFFKKWWPLLFVIFMPFIAALVAIWNHFHTQIIGTAKAIWNAVAAYFKGVWAQIKAVASMVWAGIRIAIINPITDTWHTLVSIWHTISGWLSSAWSGIRGTAGSIWGSIKSAMTGPINSAWGTIKSTVGKIKDSISRGLNDAYNQVIGIGSQFAAVGRAIIDGITSGVEGAAANLAGSVKNAANNALSGAKSFLGINSPSRVFADQVGRWIPAGIADGVNSNVATAHAAVRSVAAGTVTAFSEELEINSPSRKFKALGAYVIFGLVRGLTGSTASVKAATKRIASDLYSDLGSGHKGLQRTVARDNSQLLRLARQRDSVAGRLKAAQKKLADLNKAWASEKSSVASGIMQSASIITTSPNEARSLNANDVLAQMQKRVQAARQFAAELDQLRKKGLRSDLIQQLATAGVDQAGDTALALAAGSKSQIQQMNKLQAGLSSAANATGTAVANSMYGAGIQSAKGLVKGLQSQEHAIQAQMTRIAKLMQSTIKKALKIRSPSGVMADLGDHTAMGMAVGISRSTKHVQIAAAGMAMAARQGAAITGGGGAGGRGNTYVTQVYVTVEGTVTAERDLVTAIETRLTRIAKNNPGRGFQPANPWNARG